MKIRAILTSLLVVGSIHTAVSQTYDTLKADAEKLFSDGSYARANEIYRSVSITNLPPEAQRWVSFRLADTQWRAAAATQNADTTKLDEARADLEKQIRDLTRTDQHDRIWAEVQESLGDYGWTRRNNNNWGEGWPHYQAALDWWAGTADIEAARARYLGMVWRMARPPFMQPYYSYGNFGNIIPRDILENALKIAQTDDDKAHAHYLLAMTLRNQASDSETRARIADEFDAAIKPGKKTDWYDDALYNYAQWMEGQGKIIPLANGSWTSEPDYVKALELFRRMTKEFTKGETRYWDQAEQQIKNITEAQVNVSVGNIFLPDSEVQYQINWRNVKKIEFALYSVQLNRDVNFPESGRSQTDWLHSINLSTREKIKTWSRDTKDTGEYKPGYETVPYAGKLKPGAYVIEASTDGKTSRDLVLVTDATIVLKNSSKQALVYLCNAIDGSPLVNGKVVLWERWNRNNQWYARSQTKSTGSDGIAVFDLITTRNNNNVELFASAIREDRQAFSPGNSYWYGQNEFERWKIYAFTDRPAYRPKETVNWKFTARSYDGSVYSTPSDQTVEFEISDPRGTKVKSDKVTLNAFGSAWGTLELTEQMPLGEYRIQFWNEGRGRSIGNATLFRLEEYKLPEFKVVVKTPEENGQKKTFKLGEVVEADIQADYYFGGPVGNADVEVLVYQNPFWRTWHQPREFGWFYEDMDNNQRMGRGFGGGGQIIKRETIKTDAEGKAHVKFETPRGAGQDFEYRIEARVTDSSRREIVGNGTVRVTQQRYYVDARSEHNLYRPQDRATVDFKALDANDQPVQTEGTVKITRDYWYEIWLDPSGKEVKDAELARLQARATVWPPVSPGPVRPPQSGWTLKFRGYQHEDILTQTLKTDTNGAAHIEFRPERDGYYRVAWTSDERASGILPEGQTNQNSSASRMLTARWINAETTVWVCSGRTTELGYRYSGVQIIADKDTFRVGQRAPVMLVAPRSDRYVLFSVQADDFYSYQLVHLEGTVKLIELPIEEKHVPNVFLDATLVSDRQIFTDNKQIVVPPVKNFLNVDVKPDAAQHQPRDNGSFTITTKNDEGKPVSAEVSFGLVDESVFYIQSDYAGDPRQFYYGTKRQQQIQMQSTMNQKSYAKLVFDEKEQLIDDRDLERRRQAGNRRSDGMDANGMVFFDADKEVMDQSVGFNGYSYSGLTRDRRGGFGGGGGGFSTLGPMAANSPAPTMRAMAKSETMSLAAADAMEMPGQPGGEAAVVVRSDFRSTIVWQPDVITDKDGKATVTVKYPDSLTGWKATARAISSVNQFGIGDTTTRTKQPLIVRLQAPRFFVVGDTVTISAVINNNTDSELNVSPVLAQQGLEVSGTASEPGVFRQNEVKVPANGEARVDWTAQVKRPGEIRIKVLASVQTWILANANTGARERITAYSDAMEKSYVAYDHGIEKFISKSGKARANDFTVKLDLPAERKADSTSLTVQVTPSMAVTMLDALPYLINYPYGCTEQTMSRFLPTVITAKTLRDVGLDPEDVMGRLFGGIESNSAAATHPDGKKNLAEMDKMTQAGLDRLYDFQHSDGGWGWWKEGESDHWMTAYVVWGLSLARDAGVKIKDDVVERAVAYLDKELVEEEENYDQQAWMLHALSVSPVRNRSQTRTVSKFQSVAFEKLWANRDKLNAYTRSLLALAAHYYSFDEISYAAKAKTLIENLENGVIRDERPDTSILIGNNQQPTSNNQQPVMGTAHWGNDGIYWRWSDGGVEATAFALRAMLAIDPTNKLIERTVNWLIKNRRGAQWNNTRDTAIVVLAMNDYVRVSGELKPEMEYELFVNGTSVATKKIAGADVFNAPSRFTIDPKLIKDANEIRIVRKSGNSPIYFSADAKFFSLEEPITPAGNEIFVKREYFKLAGRQTLLKGLVYDRQPLRDGESVKSGERVECIVTVEAKNNYEYLLFEDLKPAGFEAVEVRSGESLYAKELKSGALPQLGTQNPKLETADYTGRNRWVYQELRDRKVALFVDKLPQGVWQMKYDFRAEVPGKFHALPVLGQAMYVPEIRANSAEIRVNVEEAK